MKIAYNPTTAAALTQAPANNDITFDLKGLNIFVRGVKFKGTDTTYSVFKKHTSSSGGGYNGLVPVPSYTSTNTRFLREDGTWQIPSNQYTYSMLNGTDLNTLKTEGKWYYILGGSTNTNGPTDFNNGSELYIGRNASGYRYQKVITAYGLVWFRIWNNSTWGEWKRWYTDANTDSKVLLSESTTSSFRPIILGYNNSTNVEDILNSTTNLVYVSLGLYALPNTGTIYAKVYRGLLNGTISSNTTGTTQALSDNSTKLATTAYVRTAIANLIDGAPETLDTLKEIADYLQDGNVAGGIVLLLANKVNRTGDTMTGKLTINTSGFPALQLHNGGYTETIAYIGNGLNDDLIIRNTTGNSTTDLRFNDVRITYKNQVIWHLGNDGHNSGLDADTLDGTHKTGLFTALTSTSSTNLNITIGGTTKTITNLYANIAEKLGTETVGSSFRGIYLNEGIPTALSATIGSSSKPVYMNNGSIVACLYQFGNSDGESSINNGKINDNLNADMIDGFHWQYYWSTNNADYIKLATIKINSTYINTPIEFRIKGRSGGESLISIQFSNINNNDPSLYVFKGFGIYSGYITRLKIYKSATSTWEIWLTELTLGYDSGFIHSIHIPNGVSFTFENKTSDSLPTYTTSLNCIMATLYSNISGNSSTATKLQTARQINGTNFDGTLNITTSYWGTSRSITIGNTTKSVNGSANVSWSLSEIGVSSSSHTHTFINSLGTIACQTDTTRPSVGGLSMLQAYNNGYPILYGNVINLKGSGDGQILIGWSGTSGASEKAFIRSRRDTSTAEWSPWALIYTSVHKPTPSDIGAAPASHTHSYLPLSGGTMNSGSLIKRAGISKSWIQGRDGALLRQTSIDGYSPFISMKTAEGSWDIGVYSSNRLHFSYITDTNYSSGNNTQTANIYLETSGIIHSNGFRKSGSSNQRVLLGDGSDKPLSDFSMAHSHPYLLLLTLSGTTDINTLKDNKLYYTTSDSASLGLVNTPFNSTFLMILTTNFNSGSDIRRSRLALNGYGEMKIFNDRGTSGDDGVWYSVWHSGNFNPSDYSDADHNHDSRYVNITGDTMTGTLTSRSRIYAQLSGRTDKVGLFHSSTSNKGGLILLDTDNTEHVLYLTTSNLEWKGRKVWDSGNDGHNSGMDADTLDTHHASEFILKSEEINNNVTTITKTLNITSSWMDTGIAGDDLSSGTYVIQLYINDSARFYQIYNSGIISWFSGNTNDTEPDEIILHRAGHAYNKTIYLRTLLTTNGSGGMKLLIAASSDIGENVECKFKFKRII